MPTTNVFEAVLGSRAVKWDAFWRFFEWLLSKEEGHGLGDSVRVSLLSFTFGQPFTDCKVKREHPVRGQTDGKGKWADLALGVPSLEHPTHLILMDDIGAANSGSQRKLRNLDDYRLLSQQTHPNARVRAVAVTDASEGVNLAIAVDAILGAQATDFIAPSGWKLLPLHTIGTWVRQAIEDREEQVSEKMKIVLNDFVEWCAAMPNAHTTS